MASATTLKTQAPGQRVKFKSLLWVGPLAIVASVVACQIVRLIAVPVLGISPEFMPLSFGPPVFFSAIGALGATIAFAIVGRFAQRPVALYRTIALVVLVLSLIPDALLYFSPIMPGITLPAIATLMVMHIVTWAICVNLLTRLAVE